MALTTLDAPGTQGRAYLRAYLPALGAAAAAMLLSRLAPALGALLLALLLGAVLANSGRVTSVFLAQQATTAKWMLRAGVVMLGLRLPFQEIAAIGGSGVVVVAGTVSVTYFLTRRLGARLGLDEGLVTLLAAGFSICGAAAIAAVSDVVRSRQRDVALAVAMVTVFGGLMIGLLPWAATVIGLDDLQTAVWAGASIHEVAQVAAAASLIGGNAVAFAMLVKLGRVALLAPVSWVAGRSQATTTPGPKVPLFLMGFAAMATLRSVVPLPDMALDLAATATTLLLTAGMFGLGLGLRLRDLWPVPPRLLLLAATSTAIALGTSLALILVVV
ncbi:MAG TPA: putative sulfate exporter family transporter [Marmoricola sp.]|nr:putative sulfate exporter family transporter [Marmoricola sp.]